MKPDEVEDFKITLIRFLLNYFTRFSLAGIAVYVCWIPIQNYNYWFSWHVILCTFAYVPLMAEAIMLFTGDEIWITQLSKDTKNKIHGILIAVASVFTIIGSFVCFFNIQPGYHLYTAHGITGLISMLLIFVSLGLGWAAQYLKDPPGIIYPIHIKLSHNVIGMLAYLFGLMSLCFGYYTRWFVYFTTVESRAVALVFTIIASAWTLNGAIVSGYNQINTFFN
ncbi:unnamed protein product [Brassicogethes aeneus]|uniref:ascorbate ferrireductase (transmembrane) n=1 Tax=Brassicogethes aeneus TaxID=1431903 RepID=A0A9P0AWS3_BRAAE|nr:unnamed protein product [Brassicogethes aeneus]